MASILSINLPVFGVTGTVSVPTPVVCSWRRRRVMVAGLEKMMAVVTVQGRSQSSTVARLIWHALCVCGVLATIARRGHVTSTRRQVFMTLSSLPSRYTYTCSSKASSSPCAIQPGAQSDRVVNRAVDGPEF